ncbi:putative phospholipase/carboxylesterase [Sphaerosporella brunnea]|uniref:Putative phospholipase/carboxylesterase n=1 Tax=Sphaerosporella brunnea TaxID=1250544 RepID=A0A5J5EL59_9PEZI|nr:putative phospholipase/carboxylesterase [Sphaerosporella brunnea]
MAAAAPEEPHVFPPTFVVSPLGTHTHTLILLHGRGDSGPSFGSGVYIATPSSGFTLPSLYPGLKFVFPTTAERYSTTFRKVMNEWFDTVSLSFPEECSHLQREGLREAVAHINSLIDIEIAAGVPEGNIILGGISQGCATALHVLLSRGRRLGGFVGMSGWMPFASNVREICGLTTGAGLRNNAAAAALDTHSESESEKEQEFAAPPMHIDAVMDDDDETLDVLKTPVFLAHGDADETVDYKLGRNMYTTLKHGLGMDTRWRRYREFGHWYKEPDEIDDIIEFWGEKCGLIPS